MFYSKGRLASSDRIGLAICVVQSFLFSSAPKKWAHVRLSTGDTPVFICRGKDMQTTHTFGEEFVAETSSESLVPCWRDSEEAAMSGSSLGPIGLMVY